MDLDIQAKYNKIIMIYFILLFCLTLANIPFSANAQIDENNRKFDYYFYEALNSKAQGKYGETLDLLQHCYSLDSTNANVLVELGSFYSVLQDKEKALDYFKKAVYYDKTNYYYGMLLANASRELKLTQDVVNIYSDLLELYPNKPELLFELANAYADNGETEKAIEKLNELENTVGASESLAFNKFRLYSIIDNKEKAFEEIQQIIDKNPGDPRYIILMGDLYMDDNQKEKALTYYEQAKLIDPDYPALILSLVNYYERTGNSDAAQYELRNAITGTTMEVDAKIQLLTRYLGILQQNSLDLKQANPLFESLFEQHPNNTQINLIYGNVLSLQGDYTNALKQFEIFIEDNPDNPSGYEQIIRIALPQEDYNKVKEITTKALKYMPQEPQFYYYLGAVNYQEKKYKEALAIFEKGIANARFNNRVLESDFYGQIGDLNYFLGNEQEAFYNYDKALQLNPQNIPVLNNYSYYLSLDKRDLDRAEQMSGITVKAEPLNPTYLDTYGWILYEQGSYIMAKIYIEKAIEYETEPSAVVYEHYGDVLYRTGEPDKAIEQWKRARELGGDSKELKRKIRKGKM